MPQWRSRGKFIDLVITDRAGRRLAVEADGEQHHETVDDALIPEDVYRQQLLQEVGWVFHRVRHTDFVRDPDHHAAEILRHLATQPPSETLASQAWEQEPVSLSELERLAPPAEPKPPDTPADRASGSAATTVEDASAGGVFEQTSLTDEDLTQLQLDARMELEAADENDQDTAIPDAWLQPAQSQENDAPELAVTTHGDEQPGAVAHEPDGKLVQYTHPKHLDLTPTAYNGAHLHDVPLALLPQQIAIVVAERGGLDEDQVADAYAQHFGVEVPRNRQRLLSSFAWSAGGRKFIQNDGDRWVPGPSIPHPIEDMGSWSMRQIEESGARTGRWRNSRGRSLRTGPRDRLVI